MCTGRVDLEMVLRAFLNGADGVFIGGCRLNECNYTTQGNYDALNMVLLCKKILEYIGVNSDRLRIEFMTSGDGILFAEIMNEFGKQVRKAGPLGTGDETALDELKPRLEKIIKLVPYIKIMKNGKLGRRLVSSEEYDSLFSKDEIDRLFGEMDTYQINPEKCQSCGICARQCPVEAISGEKKTPYTIDQDKCIRCGTCLEACPSRFNAISRYKSALFKVIK
ncbi:MAG: iron-sulfur protein [Chloroflexi bacterium RBG_13_46_14]|nr:MAG: iron-sulfur protein [Chloroflexi bacterium RBG_13_46_14]